MNVSTATTFLAFCLFAACTTPDPTGGSGQAAGSQPRPSDLWTFEFEVEIAAPVERVWEVMFSPEGYGAWTRPFAEDSYFEGTWEQGEPMRFLALGGSGMAAVIEVNRLHELMSIKHLGFVVEGVEDTTSEAVTGWAPAYENYLFRSTPHGTAVRIEQEALSDSGPYMQETWPAALAALKELCE